MKLNFWQWLGVVLLVLGVSYYIYGHYLRDSSSPAPAHSTPATQAAAATRPAT
jgi:hypothetical protein